MYVHRAEPLPHRPLYGPSRCIFRCTQDHPERQAPWQSWKETLPSRMLKIKRTTYARFIQVEHRPSSVQSRSSSSRSSLGGFASSFFHRVFACATSMSGKTRSKTSEYHETGLPSMPSLMFCESSVSNCSMSKADPWSFLPGAVRASRSYSPWGR